MDLTKSEKRTEPGNPNSVRTAYINSLLIAFVVSFVLPEVLKHNVSIAECDRDINRKTAQNG